MNKEQKKILIIGLVIVLILFISGNFLVNQAKNAFQARGSIFLYGHKAQIIDPFNKFIGLVIAGSLFLIYKSRGNKKSVELSETPILVEKNDTELLENKLAKLKDLRVREVISEEEYNIKRQKMINETEL